MDLFMFDQALDNVVKVARILRGADSHALLIGVSGVGKQTTAKLSSFISQCEFFESHSGASELEFKEAAKSAMKRCGLK